MLGLGWTEMLVVGIAALSVIGPKDLPVMMARLGKMVATVRRMGSEFQREINKTTGLDQVTDLRRSITEPLKKTAAEITREFNKPLSGGGFAPSGAIKPAVAGSESVVKEIHEKVGMTPPAMVPLAAPKAVESPAPVEAIAPVSKPVRKPRVAKTVATPTAAPAKPAKVPAAAKKPAAPRKKPAAKAKPEA
ncbi:MAG: Sec-independent protein translocase protein TatB [Devosia sp.]